MVHGDEFADAVRAAAVARSTRVRGDARRARRRSTSALVATAGDAVRVPAPRAATTATSSTPAGPPVGPKGVVWRQEDIFFAALGGGNPGGPPITRPRRSPTNVLHEPGPAHHAVPRPRRPAGRPLRLVPDGTAHARVGILGRARHAARRRHARARRRAAPRRGARARPRRRASGSVCSRSSATPAAARSSRRSSASPTGGTTRACACSARAARCSRPT